MVTPAVMAPFTPELWDWLPGLLYCARHCGAAEMEAHLLALEEAGLAQGKKRKPITAAQLKKLWKVKNNKDSTCTIADYRGGFSHPVIPAAVGPAVVTQFRDSSLGHKNNPAHRFIRSLTLPASLTGIGEKAFEDHGGNRHPCPGG